MTAETEKTTVATGPSGAAAEAPVRVPAGRAIRRSFSSPWASLLVILLTVLWTVPTVGLFITSLRPSGDATKNGWWTVFLHPSFTLENYKQVALNGGYGVTTGMTTYFVNSLVISIPATLFSLAIASLAS